MGRKNKSYFKDLHQQAYDKLTSMLQAGEGQSKKAAKLDGSIKYKIFSYQTYRTYWQHIKYFLGWIHKVHPECTTLKSSRKYVNEWLQLRADYIQNNGKHYSAWTIQTEAAALTKLYGIDPADPNRFVPPQRNRNDIMRSRGKPFRDIHFNEQNNSELVAFCRGTGCRRNVLQKLEGKDLWTRGEMETELTSLKKRSNPTDAENNYRKILGEALRIFPDQDLFIHHRKDKGGKFRFAPVIGPDRQAIVNRFKEIKPDEKVWGYVSSNADIHSYRADYATRVYRMYARDLKEIPYDKVHKGLGYRYQSDVYRCRKDEKGKKLDRRALYITSKALGHNRVEVVADHYLRNL